MSNGIIETVNACNDTFLNSQEQIREKHPSLFSKIEFIIDTLKNSIHSGFYDVIFINTEKAKISENLNNMNLYMNRYINTNAEQTVVNNLVNAVNVLVPYIRLGVNTSSKRAQNRINNIVNYYEKHDLELREQIEKTSNTHKEFEEKLLSLKLLSDGLTNKIDSVDKKMQNIDKINESVEEYSIKIEHGKNEIDKQIEIVGMLREEVDNDIEHIKAIYKTITSYHNEVEQFERKLNSLISLTENATKETDTTLDEIDSKLNEYYGFLDNTKKQIIDRLGEGTSVSVAESFKTRHDKIMLKNRWILGFIFASALAGVLFILLPGLLKLMKPEMDLNLLGINGNVYDFLYYRLTVVIIPGSIVALLINQYIRNRKLEEMYGFKYVISIALDGYRKVLQDVDSNNEQEVSFIEDITKLIQLLPNDFYKSNINSDTISIKNLQKMPEELLDEEKGAK